MAKCDQGYLCIVCGREVTSIVDSDLYLRFVIGQLDPERLHLEPERHLRCNPVLAQFIDDERFEPLHLDGEFSAASLDESFAAERRNLISRGYRRLWEILEMDERDVTLYPLADVREGYH